MSRSLLLAAPSVPRPTGTRARRIAGTGAVPLASFMLLSGLCETPTPRVARMRDVGRRHVDGVGGERSRAGCPTIARSRCSRDIAPAWPCAACRAIAISSRVSARWMMSGALARVRGGSDRLQHRGVERVHRVRRKRRRDQIVAGELLDERRRRAPARRRRFRIGDRKLDDGLAEHAAQPALARRPRDLLLEVIHVGIRRRPRLDHLERGQPGADAHELRRDRLGLGRERCISGATPSAPDRRPAPGRAPSARACGC